MDTAVLAMILTCNQKNTNGWKVLWEVPEFNFQEHSQGKVELVGLFVNQGIVRLQDRRTFIASQSLFSVAFPCTFNIYTYQ